MCWGEVELPGQYLFGHEVNVDNNVLVEGISSNVAIVRRQYSSYRRLSFICSDGRTRHMLVQSGQNALQVGRPTGLQLLQYGLGVL
jgi:phosphatidylinositol kinase/protein kinase (PI-3  family)